MSIPTPRSNPVPPSVPAPKSRFSRLRRAKETPLTLQFKRANDGSAQAKYFLISDPTNMSTPANPKTVLRSVLITITATLIALAGASSMAFSQYRAANHLPHQIFHGLLGDYTGPASVDFSMLGSWVKVALVAVAIGYPIVHALFGRAIFTLLHGLCLMGDRVFLPDESRSISKWTPETKMLAGALWPASMLLIPFLAVGVTLGWLYRRLWAEPLRQ